MTEVSATSEARNREGRIDNLATQRAFLDLMRENAPEIEIAGGERLTILEINEISPDQPVRIMTGLVGLDQAPGAFVSGYVRNPEGEIQTRQTVLWSDVPYTEVVEDELPYQVVQGASIVVVDYQRAYNKKLKNAEHSYLLYLSQAERDKFNARRDKYSEQLREAYKRSDELEERYKAVNERIKRLSRKKAYLVAREFLRSAGLSDPDSLPIPPEEERSTFVVNIRPEMVHQIPPDVQAQKTDLKKLQLAKNGMSHRSFSDGEVNTLPDGTIRIENATATVTDYEEFSYPHKVKIRSLLIFASSENLSIINAALSLAEADQLS